LAPLDRRDGERAPLPEDELFPLLPALEVDRPPLRDLDPLLPELVWFRTPRAAPRATPATTSPAFSAPVTPRTAPRRSVSRVRGENTAAVAAATNADWVLNKSSSATVTGLLLSDCVVRYPARFHTNDLGRRAFV
jgi:hypothetical protein